MYCICITVCSITMRHVLCLYHCLLSYNAPCIVSVPLSALLQCAMYCVCTTVCSLIMRHELCLYHCLLYYNAPCIVSVSLSALLQCAMYCVCITVCCILHVNIFCERLKAIWKIIITQFYVNKPPKC